MSFKNQINQALEGYKEIQELAEEEPEKARKQLLEVLENPMMSKFLSLDGLIERVKELDLPEEKDELQECVQEMIDEVKM